MCRMFHALQYRHPIRFCGLRSTRTFFLFSNSWKCFLPFFRYYFLPVHNTFALCAPPYYSIYIYIWGKRSRTFFIVFISCNSLFLVFLTFLAVAGSPSTFWRVSSTAGNPLVCVLYVQSRRSYRQFCTVFMRLENGGGEGDKLPPPPLRQIYHFSYVAFAFCSALMPRICFFSDSGIFWVSVYLCMHPFFSLFVCCVPFKKKTGPGDGTRNSMSPVERNLTNLLSSLNAHPSGIVVFDRLIVPKEVRA